MKSAIEKAAYYSNILPSYLENPIIFFNYSDKQSLIDVSQNYLNSVDSKSTFGGVDGMCYQIISNIYKCYDSLLLSQIHSIYIVNRKDLCIRLYNEHFQEKCNMNENDDVKIAIIKVDSVTSELPSNTWRNILIGTGLVSLTAVGGYFGLKEYGEM